MGRFGMIAVLGIASTDKRFLEELCKYLMNRDKGRLEKFLRTRAALDLSQEELDYLMGVAPQGDPKRDICKCLRELSECLGIEYDDDNTKRH